MCKCNWSRYEMTTNIYLPENEPLCARIRIALIFLFFIDRLTRLRSKIKRIKWESENRACSLINWDWIAYFRREKKYQGFYSFTNLKILSDKKESFRKFDLENSTSHPILLDKNYQRLDLEFASNPSSKEGSLSTKVHDLRILDGEGVANAWNSSDDKVHSSSLLQCQRLHSTVIKVTPVVGR